MANPREYTCKLLEMVDSGILSAADVMNAALLYMSDSDEESTEENDSGEEEAEITVGGTVIVDGVEYVAMPGPERGGCTGCAGNRGQLCNKLPDCGGFIFVRGSA